MVVALTATTAVVAIGAICAIGACCARRLACCCVTGKNNPKRTIDNSQRQGQGNTQCVTQDKAQDDEMTEGLPEFGLDPEKKIIEASRERGMLNAGYKEEQGKI